MRMPSPYICQSALVLAGLLLTPFVQAEDRWKLDPAGGGILWNVQPGAAHDDHIEMSGRKVSYILNYGVDADGRLSLRRQIVFPLLRTIPNDTHASLIYAFGDDAMPRLLIEDREATGGTTLSIHHQGIMTVQSAYFGPGGGRPPKKDGSGKTPAGPPPRQRTLLLTRTLFPSTTGQFVLERLSLKNESDRRVKVEVEQTSKVVRTNPARGVYGEYVIESRTLDAGERNLQPGESTTYSVAFSGRKASDPEPRIDPAAEESARRQLVASYLSQLVLETPDPVLNTAFGFAKIRATESIYETKGGLMHGPGGGSYYAAIWANDQAEYADPFFPFLGDPTGNASAINSFRLFAKYMNPEYKPIPSSIIAEGTSYWNGAGDRGDMAMIAYGAARFALANGDRKTAEELWPLIAWSLEFCRRRVNQDGVVASDSDELEGRFPAGKANLNTSSLYYDALNSAAMLGRDLGRDKASLDRYADQARQIRAAIGKYFGANVEGFDTYRYYDGNTVLRAWICTPLAMGIFDRSKGTIEALFSPRLWTQDGLASQAGDKTFWDRATLYALRGVLAAGETQRAMQFLSYYSKRRLLGDHVPYPVEAWPEGGQRHLAAESALYCRVYTEGLFGIRPSGLRAFTLTPRLPSGWPEMAFKNVRAFGQSFDIQVKREGEKQRVEIVSSDRAVLSRLLSAGESVSVQFPE